MAVVRDWLEAFSEFLFHVTADVCDGREPRQICGICSLALAALLVGGCVIRVCFGQRMDNWDVWLMISGCVAFVLAGLWLTLVRRD